MAVARRRDTPEPTSATAASRPRPRGVKAGDVYAESQNPIAEQLIRLEGALSSEAADTHPRYSGKVRLAILIGAPAALWTAIALAAMGIRALL